jgi:hemoglobin/transferrin/lactoferrin receptor protein
VTTAANGMQGGIAATESADLDFRNLTKGFQGGFNYQFSNRLVIGVEGDFSWTKFRKTQDALAMEGRALAAGNFLQAQTDYKFDWTASLRGRFGYALDRLLIYATGGVAFLKETEIRTQYRSNSASASAPAGSWTQAAFKEQASATRKGWTGGAGFEYALTNNWSLRGEYAYDHFGNENFLFPNATAGVTLPYSVSTRCTPFPACLRTGPATIVTNFPGSSQTTNGRVAQNTLDLQAITIGLNYRF